ncbi:MAG: histidine phosphatase family protein [Chloroflexi bacterium]|nr:histidine phosphatase family protein [Chloroflexota bacterium]
MRLVIARHGSTEWTGRRFCGRSDPPLSEAGRAEARPLARWARDVAPRAEVITSPQRRCLETARLIDPGARVDERLREVDLGETDGLTFDEVAARYPQLAATLLANRRPDVDWPGGETWAAALKRASEVWLDMTASRADPAILVTHSLIGMALYRCVDLDPGRVKAAGARVLEGPPWRLAGEFPALTPASVLTVDK